LPKEKQMVLSWLDTNQILLWRAIVFNISQKDILVSTATISIRYDPIYQNACLKIAVNKQLNDKERVVAALENPNLRQLVDECLSNELYSC
jgi:hypothetical protein